MESTTTTKSKDNNNDVHNVVRHGHFNDGKYNVWEKKAKEETNPTVPDDLKISFMKPLISIYKSKDKNQLQLYLNE